MSISISLCICHYYSDEQLIQAKMHIRDMNSNIYDEYYIGIQYRDTLEISVKPLREPSLNIIPEDTEEYDLFVELCSLNSPKCALLAMYELYSDRIDISERVEEWIESL